MSKRARHRARYVEAWNAMDAEKLLASVADDFLFDDPTDAQPVTKAALAAYLPKWPAKAAALGAAFEFEIVDKVVRDDGRLLLEWYWWRLIGADVEGSAVIKTSAASSCPSA